MDSREKCRQLFITSLQEHVYEEKSTQKISQLPEKLQKDVGKQSKACLKLLRLQIIQKIFLCCQAQPQLQQKWGKLKVSADNICKLYGFLNLQHQ